MPILAGQTAVAVSFNQGTYTPTLTAATTNPTLGAGSTQSGWWKRVDELIIGEAFIRFGTSGVAAGSGQYYISLPFAANTTFEIASSGAALGSVLGLLYMRDNSVPASNMGLVQLDTVASQVWLRETTQTVTNALPWVWAAQDAISISFRYQADPAGL